jgi:hypothetical protein
MPTGQGYLGWDYEAILGLMWLDGRFYKIPNDKIDWQPSDGVFVLETAAGTNIMQKPYRGASAPLLGDRWSFSIDMLLDDQDDDLALKLSRGRARPVAFVPGLWALDVFPAGQASGTLNRPIAAGIVPGAAPDGTPLDYAHTVRIYLNGNRDDAAAAVAGQAVTFAASGEIAVHYMAAFFVAFVPGPKGSMMAEDVNAFPVTVALEEIRQGSFG